MFAVRESRTLNPLQKYNIFLISTIFFAKNVENSQIYFAGNAEIPQMIVSIPGDLFTKKSVKNLQMSEKSCIFAAGLEVRIEVGL